MSRAVESPWARCAIGMVAGFLLLDGLGSSAIVALALTVAFGALYMLDAER